MKAKFTVMSRRPLGTLNTNMNKTAAPATNASKTEDANEPKENLTMLLTSLKTVLSQMDQLNVMAANAVQLGRPDLLLHGMMPILAKGLEEANLMAQISNYVECIQLQSARLMSENEMLNHELEFVRNRMITAEMAVSELRDREAQKPFDSLMEKYDEQLSGEWQLETHDDDEFLFALPSNGEDDIEGEYYGADDDNLDELFDTVYHARIDGDDENEAEDVSPTSFFDSHQTNLNDTFSVSDAASVRTQTVCRYFVKYLNEGRFELAAPVCRKMIKDLQRTNVAHKRDLAVALEVLAMNSRNNKRYAEAAAHLKEALAIYEETLDSDHPVLLAALNNLGHLYGKCKRFDKAEPLCERALFIRKRVAQNQRDVARQHSNMAVIQQQRNSFDSAIGHYREALDIYQRNSIDGGGYCIDDEDTVKISKRMADIYLKQQKFVEAGDVFKEILLPTTPTMLPKRRPIWEVAEEVERMCSGTGKQIVDSYMLKCDYREWYEGLKEQFPNASMALKGLAMVYRKMNMHNAAKMLEHCCAINDRKKTSLRRSASMKGPSSPGNSETTSSFTSLLRSSASKVTRSPKASAATATFRASSGTTALSSNEYMKMMLIKESLS